MTVGHAAFAVGDDHFLYDTATNALVPLPAAAAALLPDYLELGARAALRRHAGERPPGELRQALAFLRACRARGMLRPLRRLDFLAVASGPRLRAAYRRGPRRVTLGVTERCNHACAYCAFAGARRSGARLLDMPWETARQAADQLLTRWPRPTAPTLELFGGEPALDWALVERLVRHVRETRRRSDVELVLYTNATLLDRPRLALLVASGVVLQLSLDGPARVHDAARPLAGGGPSHARVLRLLRDLRRRAPAYFRRRVRVRCTFRLRDNLLEVFRFFDRPAFRALDVSFGYCSGDEASEADRARHREQLEVLDGWHLAALRARRPFHRRLYSSVLAAGLGATMLRQVGRAGRRAHPNRSCLPGQVRCFVSPSGAVYPCENLALPGAEIGDAASGVDPAKASALLRRQAELCQGACQGCWAFRLCSHCLLHALGQDGRTSPALKEAACRAERERILLGLRRWVRVFTGEPAGAVRVARSLRWMEAHPEG